ncbi:hypothetical protein OXPF_00520 [Oxobacter pfennigii]|uniref:Uncharacterized protein n=1 Tax=Oxobacter pfennigii TaxID=36849 RepID=A0A0P8YGX0_9CLOT|nr:FAD-dependent oxidoreductase [Oxobacter pfennigii]KPU46324.1 hypothetical protein OXPF_00520 [Oxobacter pfennigii]
MTIRINNLRLDLEQNIEELKPLACKKLKVKKNDIKDFKITKESVDARRKGKIDFIYSVELVLDTDEESYVKKLNDSDVAYEESKIKDDFIPGDKLLNNRPCIVGSGPAGLFAALNLAQKGYRPIVFERGKNVDERSNTVQKFWRTGNFDPECNVQFGEGGAGTFSDGKLTTRIKDKRSSIVVEELVKYGAPTDIVYNYKPHIGTDILRNVIKNIRNEIIRLGGEIHFSSRLTDINIENGILKSIRINNSTHMDCQVLILAIGHSARDTIEMMNKRGIKLSPKPLAVGFRVEHKQSMIDTAQYGKFASHPKLRAADYKLTYHSSKFERGCYSFCMCPGGIVVAAASEEGRLVTNGMSEHARDKENANSALVCTVNARDFASKDALSGIQYQRRLEEAAYKLGGGNFVAPVQRIDDFLYDRKTVKLGTVTPSYTRGYTLSNLNDCIPDEVSAVIKEALANFDRKIKGFGSGSGILTGVETRTSSPVRIDRHDNCQSVEVTGIYPAGEGAGYAGGIVSAAVDGIRVSEEIMKIYAPF